MCINVTTLENGFRIATENVETVDSITMGIWTGTGSRFEEEHENGIAHFLEHMIFKGTEKRTALQIAEEVESVGGYFNAYTSREKTAYFVRMLADFTDLGLDILGDILLNSTFNEEELEKERQVILQEIGRSFDTPDDIIFDHAMINCYPDQRVGWPILGSVDTVNAISRSMLKDFIGRHYKPERMVLAATGKLNHDEIVEKAEKMFGHLKPSDAERQTEKANYQGGGWFVDERQLEQIHITFGFQGISIKDDLFYASNIFSTIMGGGMSSKLFQEIREKRGLVYSVFSFKSCMEDTGTFGIYAGTGKEKLTELTDTVKELILETPGNINAHEFERAKTQLKASLLMGRESMMNRCEGLANHILTHNRPIPPEEMRAKVDAVTMEDIEKFASVIKSNDPAITIVGPWEKENVIDFKLS